MGSAGLSQDADNLLTPEMLDWASLAFVMETIHRRKLASRFSRQLKNKRVVCLHIRDDYAYVDPVLVELLMQRVPQHFPPRPAVVRT